MLRLRTALLGTLGLLLAVLGAGPPPASAAAHDARTPQRATTISPVQAVASDSVVDKYGVGIHLGFLDTPYKDADAVASALVDLGVRHVRDDLYLDRPDEYAAIRTVAAKGIGFDLIMGRPTSSGTPADYVHTVATKLPAGAVESLEGANEWDISGRDNWVDEVKTWQQQLYTAAKAEPATADLPVLSPALAFPWNYPDVGDLSQYADEANGHMYPDGYVPSNQISQITKAIRKSVPDKPLIATESGYHNATNASSGQLSVPEDVAGVYMPRLLLEHVLRGEKRVYGYELIDEFDDPGLTDPEAHFGLLRHDLTPKPAYTAMKTLLGLLSDPGPSFSPGSLQVTADGMPGDGRYLLTQQRDGRFVLLLWRDVSIYDPQQQQRLAVTPDDVTLRLGYTQDMTVYRPSDGAAPVSETTGTSLPLKLDGEVTAITIDPVRPPDPTAVTATRGDRSATVSWHLPATSAKVTGFEVSRSPGSDPTVVPAGARSLRDTGLVNGRQYTYTVRAMTTEESSAAVASPAVVPVGVPGRPGIVAVHAGRHRATLTWRSARPRGARVTAYRLDCLDRRLLVGAGTHEIAPGKYRATIRGLPAGRSVRVEVRARNDVGWGPRARSRGVTTG